jgi:hypothetical protein
MRNDETGEPVFGDNVDELLQDRIIEHSKKHADMVETEPYFEENPIRKSDRKQSVLSISLLTTALLLIVFYFVKARPGNKKRK